MALCIALGAGAGRGAGGRLAAAVAASSPRRPSLVLAGWAAAARVRRPAGSAAVARPLDGDARRGLRRAGGRVPRARGVAGAACAPARAAWRPRLAVLVAIGPGRRRAARRARAGRRGRRAVARRRHVHVHAALGPPARRRIRVPAGSGGATAGTTSSPSTAPPPDAARARARRSRLALVFIVGRGRASAPAQRTGPRRTSAGMSAARAAPLVCALVALGALGRDRRPGAGARHAASARRRAAGAPSVEESPAAVVLRFSEPVAGPQPLRRDRRRRQRRAGRHRRAAHGRRRSAPPRRPAARAARARQLHGALPRRLGRLARRRRGVRVRVGRRALGPPILAGSGGLSDDQPGGGRRARRRARRARAAARPARVPRARVGPGRRRGRAVCAATSASARCAADSACSGARSGRWRCSPAPPRPPSSRPRAPSSSTPASSPPRCIPRPPTAWSPRRASATCSGWRCGALCRARRRRVR